MERTTWIVILLVLGAIGGLIYRFGPPKVLRGVPIPVSLGPPAMAPGWFPDPSGVPGRLTWWDGTAWTNNTVDQPIG